ncbi:MAG TPA: aldo/keto reductase [Chroococcales cyanobacterium]
MPTAYNNIAIPDFMYGTAWKKEATTSLVELAVRTGFTAIDTANQLRHYDEVRVGEALLSLRKEGVEREKLFLQTKFTSVDGQGGHTPYDARADLTTQVKQSMDSSLQHLHTDYVDSYVLHGPYSRRGLKAEDWEVWGAIEEQYRSGKARMIGASNVTGEQLAELCARAKVKPMVVQNRCYAVTAWDKEVRDICKEHNIIYQGFSLLTANANVMHSALVRSIAQRANATTAQVIFKFALQVGMLPLTGTSNEQHMREDLQSDRLTLTKDEVEQLIYGDSSVEFVR